MESLDRGKKAAALARAILSLKMPSVARVTEHSADGEHYVRIEMADGLSFNLPWDFNPEHFDTVISVASIARIRGREEALLEIFPSGKISH